MPQSPVNTTKLQNTTRISKTGVVCGRRMLAIVCLLIPTVLSITTQCEAAYFLRVIIGMFAFVIVSGLMPSAPLPLAAIKKKVELFDDESCTTAHTVENKSDAVQPSNVETAEDSEKEGRPEKIAVVKKPCDTDVKESEKKEFSRVFDISIKPKDVSLTRTLQSSSPSASNALEEQVSNLLAQLEPTPACRKVTRELSALVQRSLDVTMPGAKAVVHLAGPFWRSAPFVSSVPDIEVVVSSSVAQRRSFIRKNWATQQETAPHASKGEGLKWILRVMTKQMLKDKKSFKWRRSSLGLPEAKVILVAPGLGSADQLVAFDLSLNAGAPVHNALLVAEASKLDPSIKGLLQFVRRWAKVRGMAQASMGYLSTYTWTLLVLYFLQVSAVVLPAVRCSEDGQGQSSAIFDGAALSSVPGVAALFEAFVRFYSCDFDWLHEEVSVAAGRRATSAFDSDAFPTTHRPKIQDPFRPEDDDLVSLVTLTGMARMQREFQLALTLMESEAPLSMVMQQWVPDDASEEAAGFQ